MIHGGFFEALSGTPMDPNFGKHSLNVVELFDVVWGQNCGVWGQDRRIGNLPTTKNFSIILTRGGYFEAPSGAPKDPNFGKLYLSHTTLQCRHD